MIVFVLDISGECVYILTYVMNIIQMEELP